jgi:hypothetical protein
MHHPKKHPKKGKRRWRPADRWMVALAALGLIVATIAAIAAWR